MGKRELNCLVLLFIWTLLALAKANHPLASAQWNEVETQASNFIDRAEKELHAAAIKHTFIEWNYESNITDHNEKIKLEYQVGTAHLFLRSTFLQHTLC